MGLTDLFSKLIVEHGSAEVQSKHIALFKDQLAVADKKIAELETENAALQSKLENAKTAIKELTKENKILKGKIKEYEQSTKQSTHDDLLPKEQLSILKCLSKIPTDKMISTNQIMEACKLTEHSALYHLQELEESSMIESQYHNDDSYWLLDHDGRGYLIKNKLMA